MKLVIFGATGKTGIPLVKQTLEAGHEVKAFVRSPEKMPVKHERLELIQGDATDPKAVERAVQGVDAVLSALGHAKGSPDDVQTVATRNIVVAMKRHNVERIVSLTGAGVSDPQDRPKLADRVIKFLLKTLQKSVLEDAENHADVLRRSGLDWIIVRGPMLTEGKHTGKYKVGYIGKDSGMRVSRADVADFMLKQLTDNRYLQEAPMVSS